MSGKSQVLQLLRHNITPVAPPPGEIFVFAFPFLFFFIRVVEVNEREGGSALSTGLLISYFPCLSYHHTLQKKSK